MRSLLEFARRQLTLATHRIHTLPVLVLMPHSRCNCRCVMCDIWKANANGRSLTREDFERSLPDLNRLQVRRVVFSGGEALMHPNLWTLCEMLRGLGARITLLSTGLLLEKHAADVVRWCDDVIVSLDGSRDVHDGIRNVPRAFDRLAAGIVALRRIDPAYPITARTVLQRRNYTDLPNILEAAHNLGLDQISFLTADVSSAAFNRAERWEGERVDDVALSREEVAHFRQVLEQTLRTHAADFARGFVAESPEKMRRLPRYYAALLGDADFPPVTCNAPWVSTVIEADGAVRPCFFHRTIGNIHEAPLEQILNAPAAVAFRRDLDIARDEVCRRCVCTLHLGPSASI